MNPGKKDNDSSTRRIASPPVERVLEELDSTPPPSTSEGTHNIASIISSRKGARHREFLVEWQGSSDTEWVRRKKVKRIAPQLVSEWKRAKFSEPEELEERDSSDGSKSQNQSPLDAEAVSSNLDARRKDMREDMIMIEPRFLPLDPQLELESDSASEQSAVESDVEESSAVSLPEQSGSEADQTSAEQQVGIKIKQEIDSEADKPLDEQRTPSSPSSSSEEDPTAEDPIQHQSQLVRMDALQEGELDARDLTTPRSPASSVSPQSESDNVQQEPEAGRSRVGQQPEASIKSPSTVDQSGPSFLSISTSSYRTANWPNPDDLEEAGDMPASQTSQDGNDDREEEGELTFEELKVKSLYSSKRGRNPQVLVGWASESQDCPSFCWIPKDRARQIAPDKVSAWDKLPQKEKTRILNTVNGVLNKCKTKVPEVVFGRSPGGTMKAYRKLMRRR